MKKYSTNYPLIFGIIFTFVFVMAKAPIGITLLFGVAPIVISIILKIQEHKQKKRGEETDTDRANRQHQNYQAFLNQQNRIEKTLVQFSKLQDRCYKATKEQPNAPETVQLVREVGQQVLNLHWLYVLYDEDFNNNFPFVATDGRIEACTTPAGAIALMNQYRSQHLGNTCIKEIPHTLIVDYLWAYYKMGICVLRLDNGSKPIDIWLKDILGPVSNNLIEICNNEIKGEFLRELQYGYRIKKIDEAEKGGPLERNLMQLMLTMRYNAYRSLGNGLCYVLVTSPYQSGITLYTEKALTKARTMLSEKGLSDSALVADGDISFAVYNSTVNLRVAQKRGQSAEESMVCAFTGHKEAETIRTSFQQYGINDSVLVITFDELYSHAMQCAGILIDMPTYGLELFKKDMPEVYKWREVKGLIVINIDDNGNQAEIDQAIKDDNSTSDIKKTSQEKNDSDKKDAVTKGYSYRVAGFMADDLWILLECKEDDTTWESETFTELVKKAAAAMNNGEWEGNIVLANPSENDTRYRVKNDPLNLIYQYDTLYGIVIEYHPEIGKDKVLKYLREKLDVEVGKEYE